MKDYFLPLVALVCAVIIAVAMVIYLPLGRTDKEGFREEYFTEQGIEVYHVDWMSRSGVEIATASEFDNIVSAWNVTEVFFVKNYNMVFFIHGMMIYYEW